MVLFFGDKVLILRGSPGRGPETGPGYGRRVRATLIGARGNQIRARLDQDDPGSAFADLSHRGDVGWWDRSAAIPSDQGAGYNPFRGESTVTGPSLSSALVVVTTAQLRSWIRKARENGGEYHPYGWSRSFTVANLTAELATRPDRRQPNKKDRKALRQAKAKESR